jgi:hypothetical protein
MAMRGKVSLERWLRMVERVNLKDADWREQTAAGAQEGVSASDPTRLVSLALIGIDLIPTVNELVEGIMKGVDEGVGRLRAL